MCIFIDKLIYVIKLQLILHNGTKFQTNPRHLVLV